MDLSASTSKPSYSPVDLYDGEEFAAVAALCGSDWSPSVPGELDIKLTESKESHLSKVSGVIQLHQNFLHVLI